MKEKNYDQNLRKGRKWASIIAGFLGAGIIITLGLTLTYPWINSNNSNNTQILKQREVLGFISAPNTNKEGWNASGTTVVYYPMILTNETEMWLQSSQWQPSYQSLGFSYTFHLLNTTGVALTSANFQMVYEGINPSGNYYNSVSTVVDPTAKQITEMQNWLTKNMVIDISKISSSDMQTITLYLPTTATDLPSIGANGESSNSAVSSEMFYNYFFNSGFALTLLSSNLPTTNVFENTSSLFSFEYYIPSSVVYFGNSNPSNVSTSSAASSTSSNVFDYTNYNNIDSNNIYVYNGLPYNIQTVLFATSTATSNVTLIPSMVPSSYYVGGSPYNNPYSLEGVYTVKSVSYVTKDNLTSSTISGNDITFNATDVNWNNNTSFSGVTGIASGPYISANITIANSSNQTVTFSEIITMTNQSDQP